jgi:hypothetical protein
MGAQAETESVPVHRHPSGIVVRGAAQVMRKEILDVRTFRRRFNDVPEGFRCEPLAPISFWPAYSVFIFWRI